VELEGCKIELRIFENNNQKIAELVSDKTEICNVQDLLDVMAGVHGESVQSIIIYEKSLCQGFFDLKSGLAGETMQKFSNYRMKLVPVDRSNPPVETEVPASENVRSILKRACYDCHSNESVWPWYSGVAPVSWVVAVDVNAGREELNFSTWNRLSTQQQARKLQESSGKVTDGKMPPWFYVAVHRDAALSAEEITALRDWARNAIAEQK
jgi:hypothetical protein